MRNRTFAARYIGDKIFYRLVFTLALPLILQNVVSTFVNLLDNVMVGQTGTEPMSGVSIVNQLIFVYTNQKRLKYFLLFRVFLLCI